MSDVIEIDGEMGEGGGQVLRGALALAAATGGAFRIQRIRARRPRGGLLRQHLTAVRAAKAVCGAEVHGDQLGSTELTFRPGPARAGEHELDIGSAGSASLVLQAIVPALARLDAPSRITITGGTHNPMAPPFDFMARTLVPQLARIGWTVEPSLVRPGFYPAGGGRLEARIAPARPAAPFALLERGARTGQDAVAAVVDLSAQIAARELAVVRDRLNWSEADLHARVTTGGGPGNYVAIAVAFEHVTEVCTAIGELRRSSEQVADEAAQAARAYLRSTAPVGEHLLDQLLVPLALTAGGELRALRWTGHAEAQRLLLQRWFGRDLEIEKLGGDRGVRVRVPAMT